MYNGSIKDLESIIIAIKENKYEGFFYSKEKPILYADFSQDEKLQSSLKTKKISFEEFESKGDGNCGFYVLGLSRQETEKTLLLQSGEEKVRQYLSEEIINELKSNNLGLAKTENSKSLYRTYQLLQIQQKEFEERANGVITLKEPQVERMGLANLIIFLSKNTLSDAEEYEELLEQAIVLRKKIKKNELEINNYCATKEMYANYVTNSIGKNGWLGYKSALLMAKSKKFNLYIWGKASSSSDMLKLEDRYCEPDFIDTYHILHANGFTHFNLLAVSKEFPVEHKYETDEKSAAKPFEWDSDTLSEVRDLLNDNYSIREIVVNKMAGTGISESDIEKMIAAKKLPEPKKEQLHLPQDQALLKTIEDAIDSIKSMTAQNKFSLELLDAVNLMIENMALPDEKQLALPIIFSTFGKLQVDHKEYIEKFLLNIIDLFQEEEKSKDYKKTFQLLYQINPGQKYAKNEIQQRFNKLSVRFYPDKVKTKKYSFFEEFEKLYNEVFNVIKVLRDEMIKKLERLDDFDYLIRIGNDFFQKMMKEQEPSLRKTFFERAYHFYVDARRKADEEKDAARRIEIRQILAKLLLARAKNFDASFKLDAQLYALASMKLAHELLTGRELKMALEKARSILNEINHKNKDEDKKVETKSTTALQSDLDLIIPVESKYSLMSAQNSGTLVTYQIPSTIQELKSVLQEEIPKTFFSLVVSSNKELVEYTLNKQTLTSYSKSSQLERAKGRTLQVGGGAGGAIVAGVQFYEAYLAIVAASASSGPAAPIVFAFLGIAAGVATGYLGLKIYRKGALMGERVKEAEIIARNIEQAMECHAKEKFDQFLNIFSANIKWPNVYLLAKLPDKSDLLSDKFYKTFIFIYSKPDLFYYIDGNGEDKNPAKKKLVKDPAKVKNLIKRTIIHNSNEPLHKLITPQLLDEFHEQIVSSDGLIGFNPIPEIRLLVLDYNKPWIVDTRFFIDTLIKYGFRPDGIAHLLNLIAQILLSDRLKLEKVATENILIAAENILDRIIDDTQLPSNAAEIDEHVQKDSKDWEAPTITRKILETIILGPGIYVKNAKSHFYHYYYGAETVKSSNQMKIGNRLKIETSVARINLVLLLLTKVGIFEFDKTKPESQKKLATIQRAISLIKEVGISIETIRLEDHLGIVQSRLDIIKDFMEIFGYSMTAHEESKTVKPALLDTKMIKIKKFHNIRKIHLSLSTEVGCLILPINQGRDGMLAAINKSLLVQGYSITVTRDLLASELLKQSRTDPKLRQLLLHQFRVKEHQDYIRLSQSINIKDTISSYAYLRLIAYLYRCEIQVYEATDEKNHTITSLEKIRPDVEHCSKTVYIAKLALDSQCREYHFAGLEIDSNNKILVINQKIAQTEEKHQILDLYKQRAEVYRLMAKDSEKYHHTLESQKYWELSIQDYKRIANNKSLLLSIYTYYVEGLIHLSRFELAIDVLDFLSPDIKENRGDYYYWRSIALLKKKNALLAERALNMAEEIYKKDGQCSAEKQKQILLKRKWIEQVKKRKDIRHFIIEHKKNLDFIPSETKALSKKSFNILSIDGGGIRGIIPSFILCEVEKRIRQPLASAFNLIAGTSTGGIIAAGLATPERSKKQPKYRSVDFLELYTEKGKSIFSEKRSWISSFWNPLYKVEPLRDLLIEYLGVITLSEAITDLLITAVDSRKQYQTFFFNSKKARTGEQKNYQLWQAARATSAAPTYFEPFSLDSHHFIDGGVTTNNPAQSAFSNALEWGFKPHEIFLLSLGTGRYIPDPLDPNKYSGKLFWARNLHHVALGAQEEDAHKNLLESFKAGLFDNYQRLQPNLSELIPLDGVSDPEIANLVEVAQEYVEQDDASDNSQLHNIVRYFAA